MKTFSFSLQRLLDYKRTLEDLLMAELATIRAEHIHERGRLLDMIDARDVFARGIKKTLLSGNVDDIKRVHKYMQELSTRVAAQEEKVRMILEKRDRKTEELVEAANERKSLERLRERKAEEHRMEQERAAQIFLDDVAGIRSRNIASDVVTEKAAA
jgi:flagellar protein FliJ